MGGKRKSQAADPNGPETLECEREVEFWAIARHVTPYRPGEAIPGMEKRLERWAKQGPLKIVYWHDNAATLEKQEQEIRAWLERYKIPGTLVMRLVGPLY